MSMRFVITGIEMDPKRNTIIVEILDRKYQIPFKHEFGEIYFEGLCYGNLDDKYLHELQVKYPLITDGYIQVLKERYKY